MDFLTIYLHYLEIITILFTLTEFYFNKYSEVKFDYFWKSTIVEIPNNIQ